MRMAPRENVFVFFVVVVMVTVRVAPSIMVVMVVRVAGMLTRMLAFVTMDFRRLRLRR
jgi:hypothetical protein